MVWSESGGDLPGPLTGCVGPHPIVAVERFVAGNASRVERRAVLRHVVGGCAHCGVRVYRALAPYAPSDAAAPNGPDATSSRPDRERPAAERIVERLLALPAAHAWLFAANSRRAACRAVCEVLIEESYDRRFLDPRETLRLAELAVRTADRIQEAGSAEIRGRAWGHLGNALRIHCQLPKAHQAIDVASNLLAEADEPPQAEAELLFFRAALARREGRYSAALKLANRILELLKCRDGSEDQIAAALQLIGIIHDDRGCPSDGIPAVESAFHISIRLDDSCLRHRAAQALVWTLTHAGYWQEAMELMEQFRPIVEATAAFTRWCFIRTDAKIDSLHGRYREAVGKLAPVREEYLSTMRLWDAGWTTLELAEAHNALGRRRTVRHLARQAIEIFSSLGVSAARRKALRFLAATQ